MNADFGDEAPRPHFVRGESEISGRRSVHQVFAKEVVAQPDRTGPEVERHPVVEVPGRRPRVTQPAADDQATEHLLGPMTSALQRRPA